MENDKQYDAIIIGGSYAGLSAAMALGRAIRKVLIIDDGKPCNRQTPHSHNFLTQDGNTPAAIAALGKLQALAYPTVAFMNDRATAVEGENNSFRIITLSGNTIEAKKILFATGIKDLMPAITGIAACWGISVIHCPYCHGYEYKDQSTGILINGDGAFEMAQLIHNWTKQLSLFTNGKSSIPENQMQQLTALKIKIIEKPLQELAHKKGQLNHIVFTDGTSTSLNALYARLPFEQRCLIPQKMGCSVNEAGYIQVDDLQKTTVPGIYAAGDNTTGFRAVSGAVAAGSKAGGSINHELIADH